MRVGDRSFLILDNINNFTALNHSKGTRLTDTDHAPPESVRVAVEVLVAGGAHAVLLAEVDEVAGEDEGEEPDVERRDQLLAAEGNIRAQLELN